MLFLNTLKIYLLFFIAPIDSFNNQPRILGGTKCSAKEHPYYVTFLGRDDHTCGGTLITLEWIITAAHCFATRPNIFSVKVRAGYDQDENSTDIQFRSISKVYKHPKYNVAKVRTLKPELRYDIALVRVNKPFKNSELVSVVQLPRKGFVKRCSKATAVGVGYNETVIWARTQGQEMPLFCVTLNLVKADVCQKTWVGSVVDDSIICTMELVGKKDSCYGDSGGPLMCNRTLIGVISLGKGCGMPGVAAVYINVDAFLTYIKMITDPTAVKISGPRSGPRQNNSSSNGATIITSTFSPILLVNCIYYSYICDLFE